MSVIVLLGCYYWYITHLVLPDSFFYKHCHIDIKFNHHRTCAQSQNHGTYKTEIQNNI